MVKAWANLPEDLERETERIPQGKWCWSSHNWRRDLGNPRFSGVLTSETRPLTVLKKLPKLWFFGGFLLLLLFACLFVFLLSASTVLPLAFSDNEITVFSVYVYFNRKGPETVQKVYHTGMAVAREHGKRSLASLSSILGARSSKSLRKRPGPIPGFGGHGENLYG